MAKETPEQRWNHLSYCGPINYDIPNDDRAAIKWAAERLIELELREKQIIQYAASMFPYEMTADELAERIETRFKWDK